MRSVTVTFQALHAAGGVCVGVGVLVGDGDLVAVLVGLGVRVGVLVGVTFNVGVTVTLGAGDSQVSRTCSGEYAAMVSPPVHESSAAWALGRLSLFQTEVPPNNNKAKSTVTSARLCARKNSFFILKTN